ncbi:MAG TPA: ribonuclease P protein component [Patescibacteria group bacterium]|nr:ribonuclease P protein component [Patescibacteria group bacterium]
MTSRPHRLHKTKDIETVFKRGRGFFGSFFQAKVLKTAGPTRFTVVISTKVDKRATRRNRFKRVMREIIVRHLEELRPGDYIFSVKPSAKNLYPDKIRYEFLAFLTQVKFIANNEKSAYTTHTAVPKNTLS